jgi:hypothetical protein
LRQSSDVVDQIGVCVQKCYGLDAIRLAFHHVWPVRPSGQVSICYAALFIVDILNLQSHVERTVSTATRSFPSANGMKDSRLLVRRGRIAIKTNLCDALFRFVCQRMTVGDF